MVILTTLIIMMLTHFNNNNINNNSNNTCNFVCVIQRVLTFDVLKPKHFVMYSNQLMQSTVLVWKYLENLLANKIRWMV